ncbi:hypothetical protein F4559_006379 [Saccharothrix violaceirubra]|uniref:Uncharacterized protein n=1 Tax=Saccharothrix violaceirubra TaxID=413306 RepID=A0A7W7WZ17_9PSEU|nr:hypothetical protein [Saccharothrix violaceirubra]
MFEYLVLGDVTLVIETPGNEFSVVTDSRIGRSARRERDFADALPYGSSEKANALVAMKRAELECRNREGGYWIAGSDPSAAEHALVGRFGASSVGRFALLTDGAARAVDLFGMFDWSHAFKLLADRGAHGLIGAVRHVESSDPAVLRWPRNKVSDDASVVYAELRPCMR